MSKAICPGQDTRFWNFKDIFEIQCNNCGKMVEFFKDDVSRKCLNCGERIQNPKISMGCAQWCQHAEKCLGYDPAAMKFDTSDVEDSSLCGKIISAIKLRFNKDSSIYTNAELALEKAIELLKTEKANPMLVKTAVLLLEVDSHDLRHAKRELTLKDGERQSLPVARSILKETGLDNGTIDDVCHIIEGCHRGDDIDSVEFWIVDECYKYITRKK